MPSPQGLAAADPPATVPWSLGRPATWFVTIAVIILLLAVLRPVLASPEQLLGQTRANTPTFSVSLLDGTLEPLPDPSMVVSIMWPSSGETFSVWASTTSAVQPCDAEVAQRAAELSGTRTAVTVHFDGSLATGTRVSDTATDHTIVCTQRNGMRYVIDDFSILSTSSFDTLAASWRWS
jgi:hypothetical protein